MKNLKKLMLLAAMLVPYPAILYAQTNTKNTENEGNYNSLKKALIEPDKVIAVNFYKSKDIPASLAVFKNLERASFFLDKDDKMPADVKELKNLKSLVVFSEAKQDWQTLFCGMDSLEKFFLMAPIYQQELDALKQCIRAGSKGVYSGLSKKEQKIAIRTKFNEVSQAIESTASEKTLTLINNIKDLNRVNEIKNLNTFYLIYDKRRELDLTNLSESQTVTNAAFLLEGKVKGLDYEKFPALEKLFLSTSVHNWINQFPAGIEKLSLKELDLSFVHYTEEQIQKLKSLFPSAKIILNQIIIQNPK